MREDHFGAEAWMLLEPGARRFIATAERTLRDHRQDPGSDFGSVIVDYGKALELQTNAVVRTAMHAASERARRVMLQSFTAMRPEALPLTLGQLARTLGGERDLAEHLCSVLKDGAWFTREFAAIHDVFASEARNPAAHGESVSRSIIVRWRNRLLGVGAESVLCRLAKVRLK